MAICLASLRLTWRLTTKVCHEVVTDDKQCVRKTDRGEREKNEFWSWSYLCTKSVKEWECVCVRASACARVSAHHKTCQSFCFNKLSKKARRGKAEKFLQLIFFSHLPLTNHFAAAASFNRSCLRRLASQLELGSYYETNHLNGCISFS